MMDQKYHVSSSPHVRSPLTTGAVMYEVILALLPAAVFGVWHFGVHALLIILMSVVSAVLTEFVFNALTGKGNTLRDGSAVLTGLLLALCLPPQVPLYIPYIGAVFAIAVVKGLFGGFASSGRIRASALIDSDSWNAPPLRACAKTRAPFSLPSSLRNLRCFSERSAESLFLPCCRPCEQPFSLAPL